MVGTGSMVIVVSVTERPPLTTTTDAGGTDYTLDHDLECHCDEDRTRCLIFMPYGKDEERGNRIILINGLLDSVGSVVTPTVLSLLSTPTLQPQFPWQP